ncbi:MAG: CPBP family intramembrane glutamic endopeptidase, partial [Patescibacteria group bacterium]
ALSEETVFRGFIFNRLWKAFQGEWSANLLTSSGWALIHLPVTVFVLKYDVAQAVSFLFLTFLFGVASAFVFARTGNVFSSVLLHVFWEWPIILFR